MAVFGLRRDPILGEEDKEENSVVRRENGSRSTNSLINPRWSSSFPEQLCEYDAISIAIISLKVHSGHYILKCSNSE